MFFQPFVIGIFFSLFVYHFLVFTGRTNVLSNLYYSLFCLAYAIAVCIGTYYVGSRFQNDHHLQIILASFYCCYLSLFSLFLNSVFNFGNSFKKFMKLFLFFLIVFTLFCLILSFFIDGSFLLRLPIIFALGYCIIFIFYLFIIIGIKRKNKTRKQKLVLIGFLIFFCLIVYVVFLNSIGGGNDYFAHITLLITAFIFAYALTDEFNREYKKLKILTEELENKVAERTSQLEDLNKQKTDFFINLAHEIKTPLSIVVSLFQQYLKKTEKNEELLTIQSNLDKLKRDIVHYLDLNKLEKGLIRYDHSHVVAINGFLASKINHFKTIAAGRNIEVTFDENDEELYLKIDVFAIDHIFNNLLDNAIKYNKESGKIHIDVQSDNDTIIVTISDTGIGIEKERLNLIFEPYYQASHVKYNTQGIGMGLSIVKKIMDSLKSKIEISSTVNEGSVFTLYFKCYYPTNDELSGLVKPQDIMTPVTHLLFADKNIVVPKAISGKKKILLVDDNRDLVRILINALSPDYNIDYALNGWEALGKIDILNKPDLIISDIMMDKMDGYEFREEILKYKGLDRVPFIFLTAKTTAEERNKGLETGAIDFITKPFDMDELLLKINALIKIQDTFEEEKLHHIRKMINEHISSLQGANAKKPTLSSQEIMIVSLLNNGYLYKEIAGKLNVTLNTVRTHIRRIYKKLSINSSKELIVIINRK